MNLEEKGTPDGDYAPDYDELAKKYKWFGNEVLFGLCYEYISPDQILMNLGIGTGLDSEIFYRAGLEIHGMDQSREMLDECEKKGFAKGLRKHNLKDLPYPYKDNTFDIIISVGVLHFFQDLAFIFGETERLLKDDGILAFTICRLDDDNKDYDAFVERTWNTHFTRHNPKYIEKISREHGFKIQKDLIFYSYDGEMNPLENMCMVLKKQ